MAGAANGDQLRSQRILAEPIDSRRQDDIVVLDLRVEKVFRVVRGTTLSVFVDVYNITNSNAASNIDWGGGSSFLLPSTIIGPRIARFGLKYDW